MEKHKCKLCFKAFMSGRALGGHMARSHFTNLPLPQKTPDKKRDILIQSSEPLGELTEAPSSESSSKGGEQIEEDKGAGNYGLRENPKRSFKVIDPGFLDAGSVVVQVQESESETESTLKPTRRRSKRSKRAASVHGGDDQELLKTDLLVKPSSTDESLTELEMVSSSSSSSIVSDEDVALCLLMLSRDVWRWSSDADDLKLNRTEEKQHRCETCNKVFKSSQALGGHRISHKKIKETSNKGNAEMKPTCIAAKAAASVAEPVDQRRVHECPYCSKVFGSGQALGGHKRSHFASTSAATASCSSKLGDSLVDSKPVKFQNGLIDLNLPAPTEDDDDGDLVGCQQEASAVSEANTD